MIKTIKICLICICCFSLFCCSNNTIDLGAKSEYETTDNLISMSIKEGTLTNIGVTVILVNNTDNDYIYGDPYLIECKRNNTWYEINPISEMVFNMIGYSLKANKAVEVDINWKSAYGPLPSGTYRIIKSVYLMNNQTDDEINNEKLYISSEFTIN
ncbi:MAG: hypothetical protein PHE54_01285 [Bacilli bacterium]|nr:hypothetical protein [Bacilli bacterium]